MVLCLCVDVFSVAFGLVELIIESDCDDTGAMCIRQIKMHSAIRLRAHNELNFS